MTDTAKITLGDTTVENPVLKGTVGPDIPALHRHGGVEHHAAAAHRAQLLDGTFVGAGFADRLPVELGDLVGADHDGIRVQEGHGRRLGACQPRRQFGRRLDAFRHGGQPDRPRQADHAFHDLPVDGVGRDATHKALIDFNAVEWKSAQI